MNVFVLGSGAWGTALSILLTENGHDVTLWSRRPEKTEQMKRTRENLSLAGVTLPAALRLTSELSAAEGAEMVVAAAPSYALRSLAGAAAPYIRTGTVLVSATKGIESGTNLRMSQILEEVTGGRCPVAALTGPTHAEEVSRHMAAGCVAACGDVKTAALVQKTFMNNLFRVYINDDIAGAELCGAVKNIVALGCGIIDGMALGDNTKALFMTRAMAEIARLSKRIGGQRKTCSGLAGMGDLIVTCCSGHSRNHQAGLYIGRGETVERALAHVGAVTEGYYAAESVTSLGTSLGLELPACRSVYSILYEGAEPLAVMQTLMERVGKPEFDVSWETA